MNKSEFRALVKRAHKLHKQRNKSEAVYVEIIKLIKLIHRNDPKFELITYTQFKILLRLNLSYRAVPLHIFGNQLEL